MYRKHFLATILGLIIGVLFSLGYYLLYPLALKQPGINYYLEDGCYLGKVANDLVQQRIISCPWLFKIVAILLVDQRKLQPGIYFIRSGSNIWQLLKQLRRGSEVSYQQFTIVPGWDQAELYKRLAVALYIKHTIQDFAKFQDEVSKLEPNMDQQDNFFAPDTYYYRVGDSDISLLKHASQLMQRRLLEVWQQRDPGLPWNSPSEALIAASLVEKEAYLKLERPIIAGVIINRLRINMPLQFDSDADYTYVARGLPHRAIAIASMDSIFAVLHPKRHNCLYFIATGYGGHQFSYDFAQHRLAVITQSYRHQGFANVDHTIYRVMNALFFPEQRCLVN